MDQVETAKLVNNGGIRIYQTGSVLIYMYLNSANSKREAHSAQSAQSSIKVEISYYKFLLITMVIIIHRHVITFTIIT